MEQRVERAGHTAAERRMARREEVDFVLSMSRYLAAKDRVLVDFIFGQGQTAADYARLVRCSVRTAQHRIRYIIKRIYSQHFQYFIAHEYAFPRDYRTVARRLILEGRGLRSTARLTGRSLHQVRRQRLELMTILEIQSRAWSSPVAAYRGEPGFDELI